MWNGFGDEGALALADHRVLRNIKTLKSVPLHGQSVCFYISAFVYLPIVIIVVMWNGGSGWWCTYMKCAANFAGSYRLPGWVSAFVYITSSYHFQTCRLPEQDFLRYS